MRWQAKAAVQKGLSVLPQGERLNYVLQRKVTKKLPAGDDQFFLHAQEAFRHVEAWERHGGGDLAAVRGYEFGAGWDLVGPLTLWALGVGSQVLVDIDAHMRWELVNHSADQLHRHHGRLEELAGRALRRPDPAPVGSRGELLERFGIDYRAPLDARATGMPDGAFDLITSTFTLEHIPRDDIAAIMRECARLLAPGGIVSCSVDMQDHYSFDDPRISVYNFLRYSPRRWRAVNSSLHFQNRLRARDHVELVEQAGLRIVDTRLTEPDAAARAQLDALPLAEPFASGYTRAELEPTAIDVVATRDAA